MTIAYITHHLPVEEQTAPGAIPGKYRGGAEMTDAVYLSSGPDDIDVIHPDSWHLAMEYPQVIITGTDLLNETAMRQLATKNPVVLVHHKQTRTVGRAELLSSASVLICHTPRHLEIELEWTDPYSSTWLLSHHNPADFESKEKENFALWAARLHPQKGPDAAINWASQNAIPLLMFWDKPREMVLEAMSRARHFVFLPTDFDAEPRTVIEAVLSGCQVTTNDLAGITSVPDWNNPEKLAKLVENAKDRFWELAL